MTYHDPDPTGALPGLVTILRHACTVGGAVQVTTALLGHALRVRGLRVVPAGKTCESVRRAVASLRKRYPEEETL